MHANVHSRCSRDGIQDDFTLDARLSLLTSNPQLVQSIHFSKFAICRVLPRCFHVETLN